MGSYEYILSICIPITSKVEAGRPYSTSSAVHSSVSFRQKCHIFIVYMVTYSCELSVTAIKKCSFLLLFFH
jgi:hypothetical protein